MEGSGEGSNFLKRSNTKASEVRQMYEMKKPEILSSRYLSLELILNSFLRNTIYTHFDFLLQIH